MDLYEVYWACPGASGTRHVFAPDGDTAVATVQAHPSRFGLPHDHPIVGHPTLLRFAEAELDVA